MQFSLKSSSVSSLGLMWPHYGARGLLSPCLLLHYPPHVASILWSRWLPQILSHSSQQEEQRGKGSQFCLRAEPRSCPQNFHLHPIDQLAARKTKKWDILLQCSCSANILQLYYKRKKEGVKSWGTCLSYNLQIISQSIVWSKHLYQQIFHSDDTFLKFGVKASGWRGRRTDNMGKEPTLSLWEKICIFK